MEKKNLKKISKNFFYLPDNSSQTFYRIPFSFLKTGEQRINNAWDSVSELISFFRNRNFTESKDQNELNFYNKKGELTEFVTDYSNLWIKTDFSDPESGEDLSYLDNFIKNLNQPVYKYFYKNKKVYAYPLDSGKWEDSIKGYIGLDAGSISINIAFVDLNGIIFETEYTLTEGDVINNIKKAFLKLSEKLPANTEILGSGVTGSGHEISASLLNADVYETELDAHAEATLHLLPDTQVIFDIGGQDSKVMYIEDGELDEAGMNKKCGAGTGAFLDAQADRLGIPVEKFGERGLKAKKPYAFSSMCTVFAGRDLIAEQAKGNTKENIIAGLHRSLAMNFYSTLGINKKKLKTPIAFQGGVASNIGVKKELETLLYEARGENIELYIPMYHKVMGAIGMALFAREESVENVKFRGIDTICRINSEFTECTRAEELNCGRKIICDLVHLHKDSEIIETLYACEKYYTTPLSNGNQELKVNFGG
ncbi:MAG: acyl-CoA dehydratase activase [Thermodesulfobacteriota bacterium]